MEDISKTLIQEVNDLIEQIPNDPDFQPVILSPFNVKIIENDKKDQFFEILKPKIIKIALRVEPQLVVLTDVIIEQIKKDALEKIYPQKTLFKHYFLSVVQELLKMIFARIILNELPKNIALDGDKEK